MDGTVSLPAMRDTPDQKHICAAFPYRLHGPSGQPLRESTAMNGMAMGRTKVNGMANSNAAAHDLTTAQALGVFGTWTYRGHVLQGRGNCRREACGQLDKPSAQWRMIERPPRPDEGRVEILRARHHTKMPRSSKPRAPKRLWCSARLGRMARRAHAACFLTSSEGKL